MFGSLQTRSLFKLAVSSNGKGESGTEVATDGVGREGGPLEREIRERGGLLIIFGTFAVGVIYYNLVCAVKSKTIHSQVQC